MPSGGSTGDAAGWRAARGGEDQTSSRAPQRGKICPFVPDLALYPTGFPSLFRRCLGVQVPPFALSYFNSLCEAPAVAARQDRAVVRNVVRAVRHFLLIDGTVGVVPRCAARYAARRSAASACTASRRTL